MCKGLCRISAIINATLYKVGTEGWEKANYSLDQSALGQKNWQDMEGRTHCDVFEGGIVTGFLGVPRGSAF